MGSDGSTAAGADGQQKQQEWEKHGNERRDEADDEV
jgi:hypothetical protein